MGYDIAHADSFERDYREIVDYLTRKTDGQQSARKLIKNLRNASSILAETPFIKAVSQKPKLAQHNLREYFLNPYTLVYFIEDETVRLIRLLHQSRQYDDEWYWEE